MRKTDYAAWDIAETLMSRSRVPLQIIKMHPCGGQYNCLALLPAAEPFNTESLTQINLHGESIRAATVNISPYPLRYKKNKESLLQEIARNCGYILAPAPVRKVACVQFLRDLLLDERFKQCSIAVAWYDGSYGSHLADSAARFSFYDNRNMTNEAAPHLPWWTISVGETTFAMCNTVSDELVTMSGSRYNLCSQSEFAFIELHKLLLQNEFDEVIASVISLLNQPQEDDWKARYAGYANEIEANSANIVSVRRTFCEWDPLKLYINVSNSKHAKNKVQFELRYLGQTVADLISKKALVLNTAAYDKNNARDFKCDIHLTGADWRGKEAKEFRKFFKDRNRHIDFTGLNPSNEEHRLESLFLSEFSEDQASKKALSNIQPVKIANIRFPMPTPLSASDHKAVKYSGIRGGGIDILTRTGKGGKATNLCIMELKDENVKSEPPKDAIKQAIAYATFIHELLRTQADETGQKWWNLFGFGGKVPDKLILFASCVMPANSNIDKSFAGMELAIGNDKIRLHYLYFEEKKNKIIRIETSL